ncbi:MULTISPECIES: LysE/ArgO family amino acid transporter [unclassified Halomonas]|uniref:LysE/ArgO family amino acid transporter n=1 Tax=unclassified Halomonas TaxID=2609666 RepID=UPI002076BA5F|nr:MULTISPECIES: LysE/ArgO family amino acid transporter [unclassified Halomonas]
MGQSYANGVLIGLGLIVAIGSQNAFVLSQSLRREHHLSVALVCILCDALLIAAGVFGLSALLSQSPLLLAVARWGGAAFLLGYALLALKRAAGNDALRLERGARRSRAQVLAMTLAITLLNPHVYLDTVVLLGSLGAQQSVPGAFTLGAMCASTLWFAALALAGAKLAPWLTRPVVWRLIDVGVALMMITVALQLILGAGF